MILSAQINIFNFKKMKTSVYFLILASVFAHTIKPYGPGSEKVIAAKKE